MHLSERTKRRKCQRECERLLQEVNDEEAVQCTSVAMCPRATSNRITSVRVEQDDELPASQTSALPDSSISESDCLLTGGSKFGSESSLSASSEADSIFSGTESVPPSSDQSSIGEKIAKWALSHNISHSAIKELLPILRSCNLVLPKDPRTLLQTLRTEHYDIKEVAGGSCHYIGFARALSHVLWQKDVTQLTVSINVDGMPLFRSATTALWPILALVEELRDFGPFVLALFAGKRKPTSLHEYLGDFIEEMKSLLVNGLEVENKT